MTIGQAINDYIVKRNISKYRVAKDSNISQTTLNDIITGKNANPTINTLNKIATGLGLSAAELIDMAERIDDCTSTSL